ncbi:unnamed protein product [Rotaria sp. Silwood2]|nr:unnamed protein product [Rotaria sp. Silwood2]
MFDFDNIHNAQSHRIWTVNCDELNENGAIKQKQKLSQKTMVWLEACSKVVPLLIILEEGTVFGNDWTLQQEGARPHTHNLTQQWCHDNLPDSIY